ncbi:MAG: hypothetical protein WBH76_00615, partial [Dictyoglomaceae bacterium]
VYREEDEDGNIYYKVGNKGEIYVNGKELRVSKSLMKSVDGKKKNKENEENVKTLQFDPNILKGEEIDNKESQDEKGKKKNNKPNIKFQDFKEDGDYYILLVSKEPYYDENEKTLKIESGFQKIIGNEKILCNETKKDKTYEIKYEDKDEKIGEIDIEKTGNKFKVIFELREEEKNDRVKQILNAIKNGLYAQSSNELNTIIPLFLIAGYVKVPSPVFHPYIELSQIDEKTYKVIGISDALNNGWIDGKVFLMDSERIKVEKEGLEEKLVKNWDEFLPKLDGKSNENTSSNPNET